MPTRGWRDVSAGAVIGVVLLVLTSCGGSPSSNAATVPPTTEQGAETEPTGDQATEAAAPPTATVVAGQPIDVAQIRASVGDATYRVEYLGCGGVGVAPATPVTPTTLVTDPAVVSSAWVLGVIVPGSNEVVDALVMGLSTDGLGVLRVSEPVVVAERNASPAKDGDEAVVLAAIASDGTGVDLVARLTGDPVRIPAVEPSTNMVGASAYDAGSRFVGVVAGSDGSVVAEPTDTVGTPVELAPCDEALPERGTELAAAPIDTRLQEVSLAQELATSLAAGDWDRVRQLDTPKAGFTDADFQAGWGTLERSVMLPITSSSADAATRWRLGLVAHETVDGSQTTRVFCVSWDVDLEAETVIQTGKDSKRFDDDPGWRDPVGYLPLLRTEC